MELSVLPKELKRTTTDIKREAVGLLNRIQHLPIIWDWRLQAYYNGGEYCHEKRRKVEYTGLSDTECAFAYRVCMLHELNELKYHLGLYNKGDFAALDNLVPVAEDLAARINRKILNGCVNYGVCICPHGGQLLANEAGLTENIGSLARRS